MIPKSFRAFPAFALLIIFLCASGARADTVTLTGGTASTWAGIGTVNLLGNDFSLSYSGEIPPGMVTSIAMNTVIFSIGSPRVIFSGIQSTIFRGSLIFNDSMLNGGVTAYATMDDMFFNRNPVFSVTFSGSGFISVTDVGGRPQTQFTVATPEPTTLLLFGSGLSGLVAFARRRTKPKKS